MATAKINVCTDEQTKKEVEIILADMGLNMTTAINMYLKRIQMEGGIPFAVTTRVPNHTTAKALNEYDEMKNRPDAYKRYDSFDDLMREVL